MEMEIHWCWNDVQFFYFGSGTILEMGNLGKWTSTKVGCTNRFPHTLQLLWTYLIANILVFLSYVTLLQIFHFFSKWFRHNASLIECFCFLHTFQFSRGVCSSKYVALSPRSLYICHGSSPLPPSTSPTTKLIISTILSIRERRILKKKKIDKEKINYIYTNMETKSGRRD